MLAAFVTAFLIPPSPDTIAPTFQRLSTRFGSVLSRENGLLGVSTGLSRLPLTVDQSLDNYRRWKQWFYPSESVLTPTEDKHFQGRISREVFILRQAAWNCSHLICKYSNEHKIFDHWKPRIIVRSRKIMHFLTHQPFLKKAYHTTCK